MVKELFSRMIVPVVLVAVLVLVEVLGITFNIDLIQFGIFPRKLSGAIGILSYPFIHSGWKHLFNNATALLILGTMLYFFYRDIASRTLLWVYLMSGVWLWIGGRANFHIGASGIVYSLFGFLFVSGLLRRHLKLMALSLLVVFLYGSLVWGIFPIDHRISYEGHLFGLLAGIVVAVVYRKQGPQKPTYSWDLEEEEETPDWFPDVDSEGSEQHGLPPKVNYIYRKKGEG